MFSALIKKFPSFCNTKEIPKQVVRRSRPLSRLLVFRTLLHTPILPIFSPSCVPCAQNTNAQRSDIYVFVWPHVSSLTLLNDSCGTYCQKSPLNAVERF
jgi:hypothetical protein